MIPAVHLTLGNGTALTLGLAWRKLPSFRRYCPPLWPPLPFGKCSLSSAPRRYGDRLAGDGSQDSISRRAGAQSARSPVAEAILFRPEAAEMAAGEKVKVVSGDRRPG